MEEHCRDPPAQRLLNSLGSLGAGKGAGRAEEGEEEGGLGLDFLLPRSGLDSRNPALPIWWAGIKDSGLWEKQAEAISGTSPENVFFLLLVDLHFKFLFIFSY